MWEEGARRPGRSLSDIDVTVYVRTCVTDEPAPAREALARDITGYAIVSVYARFFAECGFAEEVEAVNAAWKAGDRAGAVKGISERVLDGLGAVGSANFCREQMNAFARTGATPVVLPFAPPGPGARGSMLKTFRSFPWAHAGCRCGSVYRDASPASRRLVSPSRPSAGIGLALAIFPRKEPFMRALCWHGKEDI